MAGVFQLHVEIEGIKPKIWRRFKVNDAYTLQDLSNVTNFMFDWLGMHLSEFKINDESYGMVDLGGDAHHDLKDYSTVRLRDFGFSKGMKFTYIYDFGDWWEQTVTIEDHEDGASLLHPICIDGGRSAPPEDCGGIPGYYTLLEILADENHPDREFYEELIEEEWDPNEFDVKLLNMLIREPNLGLVINSNGGTKEDRS